MTVDKTITMLKSVLSKETDAAKREEIKSKIEALSKNKEVTK